MDILTTIYAPSRSTIFLFPRSATTSASLLPQNRKKLAQTRRRGRKRGISLRALRTNHTAIYCGKTGHNRRNKKNYPT
jgi:hypothetical protein